MSDFIVEIVDANGNRKFALVTASSQADARDRVRKSGLGYTAQQVFPNTQSGLNDLANQSQPFRESGLTLGQIPPLGTIRSSKIPGNMAPLGGGNFGGIGSDGVKDGLDSLSNLPSVFRNFLRNSGIDPNSGLGEQAQNLQNPLQNMLDLAGSANMNPFIPGQNADQQMGAQEFLNQRGLQGIAEGASNLIKRISGVGNVNAGTQEFLQPTSQGSEGANTARSAMLAALYKMAPTYASRFGAGAIDRASQSYFDQRQADGQNGGAEEGGFTDDNMIRFIRDRFGGTGIFG